jgi:uncharacterized protein (DUF433 family)
MQNGDPKQRISINPNVACGKPVIRGTRLTVEFILDLLADGATTAEILDEYKGLTQADVQACIRFAREALDRSTVLPLTVEP